jgi:uncharacterized membrane protein (TIGR02234 family)
MRSRTLAVAGLLLGAALSFLAGAQPWWRARGEGLNVAFSGTTSTGGVSQALALVTAAGTILLLTVASLGRRIVAVILLLAGLGMVAVGALRNRPAAEAVRDEVRTVGLGEQFWLSATPWPSVYAAAGILIMIAALVTIISAPRWPSRQERFSRGSGGQGSLSDEPSKAWEAMNAGLDPTEDTVPAPARRPHPDVQSGLPRDTMGSTKPTAQSPRSAKGGKP